jgi:hypothetical protein
MLVWSLIWRGRLQQHYCREGRVEIRSPQSGLRFGPQHSKHLLCP